MPLPFPGGFICVEFVTNAGGLSVSFQTCWTRKTFALLDGVTSLAKMAFTLTLTVQPVPPCVEKYWVEFVHVPLTVTPGVAAALPICGG